MRVWRVLGKQQAWHCLLQIPEIESSFLFTHDMERVFDATRSPLYQLQSRLSLVAVGVGDEECGSSDVSLQLLLSMDELNTPYSDVQ